MLPILTGFLNIVLSVDSGHLPSQGGLRSSTGRPEPRTPAVVLGPRRTHRSIMGPQPNRRKRQTCLGQAFLDLFGGPSGEPPLPDAKNRFMLATADPLKAAFPSAVSKPCMWIPNVPTTKIDGFNSFRPKKSRGCPSQPPFGLAYLRTSPPPARQVRRSTQRRVRARSSGTRGP